MVTHKDIADSLQSEMRTDEESMARMRSEYEILLARFNANKAWLAAHGYSQPSPPAEATTDEDKKETTAPVNPSVSSTVTPAPSDERTIHEVAAEMLRTGEQTITGLFDEFIKRGKNINRASLDRALRRFPNLFLMEKRGRKNYVSLKTA